MSNANPLKPQAGSVCLTMIVKDEAHVISRCLSSVRPFIDSWCIVDTGSSDGTQDLVKALLEGLPGDLHERPWRSFGENRTEAIELAKGNAAYLLFLDADETFEVQEGFGWPPLTCDCYRLLMGDGDNRYRREILVRSALPWRYEGVLHEWLTCDVPYQCENLDGPVVMGQFDGGRSQGIDTRTKYLRDAAILEEALRKEPTHTRYTFYLAQSYRTAGETEKALQAYRKRAEMGGWEEEVWYSMFQVGVLSERLNRPPASVTESYLAAYQFRPARAEPLVSLAAYYRLKDQFALAHLFASMAIHIPKPEDILFLDDSCYQWRALDEYSTSSYYLGRHEESRRACEQLLAGGYLPEVECDRVRKNLQFALDKLP